ncbi:membrane protein containing ATP-binding region, ATPase-like domain protein [Candidatus Magnetobacterium bavaricum]|uniref:histidine kinase n=1 Tax=Candidatus Magnetobacterium bavaricum TaxID=29290 RepID=A0A0F3GX48_9BACT|nr:membrane protein containing ATP-binding region, ATPase-like domain protein [Candidatus Magnetobacterium bavaricum]
MIKNIFLSVKNHFKFSFTLKMFLSFGLVIIMTMLISLLMYLFGVPYTKIDGIYNRNIDQAESGIKSFSKMGTKYLAKWIWERRGDARTIAESVQINTSLKELLPKIHGYNNSTDIKSFIDRVREEREYSAIASYIEGVQSSYYGVYEEIHMIDAKLETIIVSTHNEHVGKHFHTDERPVNSEDEWFNLIVSEHNGTIKFVISRAIDICLESEDRCVDRRFILYMYANIERPLATIRSGIGVIGKTAEIVIVDKNGRMLTPLNFKSPDNPTSNILDHKINTTLTMLAGNGNEGLIESIDARGEAVLGAFRHITITPEMGIGIIVKVDKKELLDPIKNTITTAIAVMLLGLLLLSMFTYFISLKIASPIIGLIKKTESIKNAGLITKSTVNTRDDLNMLVSTFDVMLTDIEYQHKVVEMEKNKLAEIMKTMEDGIYIVNRSHDIEFVNRAILRDFGEVNNRKCYEPIVDSDGKVVKLRGSNLDITDRKKIEDELQRALNLLNTTGHIARIGGWSLTVDTMEVTWTNEVYRIHEIEVTQPPDFNTAIVYYPEEIRSDLIDELKECMTNGKAVNIELPFVTAKGNRLCVNIQARAEFENGKIVRLVGSFQDITERKRMEEELRNLNNNLMSMVQEETAKRQMQEQMLIQQSKMAAMGDMIGLIAHQWKQPLNLIGITVQDMKDAYKFGEVNEEYIDQTVDTTMGQVNFMSKTMDDFRNFFKPSKQKVEFDVKNTIDELVTMFIAIFTKNNVNINIKADKTLKLKADGYPNEFKQVILNILNNSKDAIIAMRSSGNKIQGWIEVEITNDESSEKILVSIKDNGGGIPEDVIGRIFEPYYTTKGADGTGIGLYMSKTIIETNMGGSLTVRNIEGGAEFVIELQSCA